MRAQFPAGTRVSNPTGGLVLWVEMPTAVDVGALYEDAIRAKVCISPGTLFSARRRYQHHLRMNAGWFDAEVGGAITRLGRLAKHHARERPV